ncbi:MAG: hypothetical protein GX595_02575, partial [Lentisphaerae bacterium]|nr:hypothetical protein [Lentisphaerota bacterium]
AAAYPRDGRHHPLLHGTRVHLLTRDGGGHESPGYAAIKLDFIRVARLMQEIRRRQPTRFPAERYPDPFEQPKAQALFDFYIDAMVLDHELPSIGDGGRFDDSVRRLDAAKVRYSDLKPSQNIFAFLRRTPVLAAQLLPEWHAPVRRRGRGAGRECVPQSVSRVVRVRR